MGLLLLLLIIVVVTVVRVLERLGLLLLARSWDMVGIVSVLGARTLSGHIRRWVRGRLTILSPLGPIDALYPTADPTETGDLHGLWRCSSLGPLGLVLAAWWTTNTARGPACLNSCANTWNRRQMW